MRKTLSLMLGDNAAYGIRICSGVVGIIGPKHERVDSTMTKLH